MVGCSWVADGRKTAVDKVRGGDVRVRDTSH